MRFAFILLALLLVAMLSAPAFACVVYGGGVAYLNKPNVTVNISIITENANLTTNYTTIDGGVAFRSHHNDSLAVQLKQDEYGWSVRIGLPSASPYAQPEINYSAAMDEELNWLWNKKVINGTGSDDVSAITGLLENNTHYYVYWTDGNWTAIQNNCFPDGSCVRCGPAGAELNSTLPQYGIELQERADDEKVEACLSGVGLLLAPLCFLFLRL